MNQQKINNTHIFNLTTITPVAIGDGGVLTPFADFIVSKDNRLQFVDHKAFEALVVKHGATNDFISKVRSSAHLSKNDFLSDFIINKLHSPVKSVLSGKSIPAFGLTNVTELNTVVKNAGRPYIPGSSLKGAIKTAMLYHWFVNTQDGKAELLAFKDVLTKYRNPNWKVLESKFDQIVNRFFGDIKARKQMDFSFLKVTDSELFNFEDLIALNSLRYRLIPPPGEENENSNAEGAIPVLREAIHTGKTSRVALKIACQESGEFQQEALRFLRDEDAMEQLTSQLNLFSFHILELEEKIFTRVAHKFADPLANYLKLVSVVKRKVESAPSGEAWLRLGWGKSWYYNSAGLAIIRREGLDSRAGKTLLKLAKVKQVHSDIFPVTRVLSVNGQMPLGWVKLNKI